MSLKIFWFSFFLKNALDKISWLLVSVKWTLKLCQSAKKPTILWLFTWEFSWGEWFDFVYQNVTCVFFFFEHLDMNIRYWRVRYGGVLHCLHDLIYFHFSCSWNLGNANSWGFNRGKFLKCQLKAFWIVIKESNATPESLDSNLGPYLMLNDWPFASCFRESILKKTKSYLGGVDGINGIVLTYSM